MEIFIKPELLFCAHFEIFVYIYSVHQAEEVIKQVFLPWSSLIRCLRLHLVGTEATGCQLRTKLHGQRDWLTGKNACHTIRRNWVLERKEQLPKVFLWPPLLHLGICVAYSLIHASLSFSYSSSFSLHMCICLCIHTNTYPTCSEERQNHI